MVVTTHRPPKSYFFRVAQRVRCLATRAGWWVPMPPQRESAVIRGLEAQDAERQRKLETSESDSKGDALDNRNYFQRRAAKLEEENAKLERKLNRTLEGKATQIKGLKEKSSTYYKHVSFLADVLCPRCESPIIPAKLEKERAEMVRTDVDARARAEQLHAKRHLGQVFDRLPLVPFDYVVFDEKHKQLREASESRMNRMRGCSPDDSCV